MTATPVKTCRACSGQLSSVLVDLGAQPPSNSYLPVLSEIPNERRYPLCARVCARCKLVQLDHDVAPEELFANYAYFSSYSDQWLAHAKAYCDMAVERFGLSESSLVVELASNDGYLLKNFLAKRIPVLGVDPSNTVAEAAERAGVPTIVDFFGAPLARRLVTEGRSADLIIGNNVLAHVPDINDFVKGIALLLKPQGTVTIEFPHLLKLIEKTEFDTIYHEHFSYISLLAIEGVFQRNDLRIYDVQELPTHGGSLRVFATHAAAGKPDCSNGLQKVRADEAAAGLADLATYREFRKRVERCRESFLAFLADARSRGRQVVGYGAAAKGNTFLNYCGIAAKDIPFVADRSPHKQGKFLPGTHIPVVTPQHLIDMRPDFVLILPWNFKEEIMEQLAIVRSWGGQFLTAIPSIEHYQ